MVNTELTLERRTQADRTTHVESISITPMPGEDYWTYRVLLTERQAVVAFPKFSTLGVGFAVENEDWNTNLPYTCKAEEIASHIADNKGDPAITDESVIDAIRLIQAAILEDRRAQT